MNTKISIWWLFLGLIALGFLLRQCEGDTKIVTETEIVYRDRTDTIVKTIINDNPKTVYIEKIKTLKGKDSIIYKDKPSETTTTAQEYDVTVKTDSSSAELKITSLTKPIDVRGIIKCKEKETTTTITKTKAMSGLFLYGEASVQPVFERVELGLDYQIKNKIILGASASYNNINQQVYFNAKIGINIFNY